MTSLTIQQIDAQTAQAREFLSMLDGEAQELALPAVAGDQDAAAALARVNAQIRQTTADVAVLDRARITVAQQRREADDAGVAAYRVRHREIARDHAEVVVKLASRADELIAEIRVVLAEISATEREVSKALRASAAPLQDAVVGRQGLIQFAIASLNGIVNGTDRFNQARPVADVAKMAWADLLVSERSDDV